MKWKIAALLLAAGLIFLTGTAENPKPQKVYSTVKQRQSIEWYREQVKAWQNVLDAEPKNAEAWQYYYTANRMLKIYNKGVTAEDLDKIVADVQDAIPNSFEYHYLEAWNNGYRKKDESWKFAQQAYQIDPTRPEVLPYFFNHYEMERDKGNLKKIAQQWFATNDISSNVFAWNYNMLQSTEANAILFTGGDNDTYPALILQYAKDVRTDVAVINTSLMLVKDYRNKLFSEIGIPPIDKDFDDFESVQEYEQSIIHHVKKHSDRPIYFVISMNERTTDPIKEDLHITGLASKWSKDKFDNIAVTKRNYEKRFLTDYIKLELQNDLSQGIVDQMGSNYLLSMLTLYNHYEESESEKIKDLEKLIDRIATKNNMTDKVNQMLNKTTPASPSKVVTDPRKLLDGYVQINDTLYASTIEVSNEMYELFLTDLLKQRRYDEVEKYGIGKVDWQALLPPENKTEDMEFLFRHGKPDAGNFPVVNITKSAANAYANWLTTTYNNTDHRRKKIENVIFRLPTEKEWEFLAYAGKKNTPYAWGGAYVRNTKGCFLGNLDVSEVPEKKRIETGNRLLDSGDSSESLFDNDCEYCKQPDRDGGLFPVITRSYLPNGLGLYNMTGNVSEMVANKPIVKGGSWNTKAGVATLGASEKISLPSPEVGFRLIMIVE